MIAKIEAARAPRGTKSVSQAFFAALESIPEAARSTVAKAAQTAIRDELKARREKIKMAAAKEKARKPAPVKKAAKTEAAKPAAAVAEPAPAKRRTRKAADTPAVA